MRILGVVLLGLAGVIAVTAAQAALVMILLGVTHHELGWPAHGIGFWPSAGLTLVLGLATSALRRS